MMGKWKILSKCQFPLLSIREKKNFNLIWSFSEFNKVRDVKGLLCTVLDSEHSIHVMIMIYISYGDVCKHHQIFRVDLNLSMNLRQKVFQWESTQLTMLRVSNMILIQFVWVNPKTNNSWFTEACHFIFIKQRPSLQ